MKKQQIQQQEQLSAYDKKVIYDMFYMSIEWLEKYIEIAYKNEFPNWESRKQVRDNLTIKRTDIYNNPEKAKKAFSTQMFLFGTSLDDSPIFREDLKKELHQWISATKIDNNNCPNELKHLLYGFNEVMDGNMEKVLKDMENRKREYEIDSPEYMEKMNKLFSNVQIPMHGERETQQNLADKTHLSMEFGNRFSGGNAEQGEQAFDLIAGTVASEHKDFHFYPQQGQQSNLQQRTNSEIIQDIRQNPQNWRTDEIITEFSNSGTSQESVLIHQSARLDDYDQRTGKLNFDGNTIYRANRFSAEEQAQINQALNISQQQVQQQHKWSWE